MKPIKSFNKYFCPGCDKYFGRETHGEMEFEKVDRCPKCDLQIDWENGFESASKNSSNVCAWIPVEERLPVITSEPSGIASDVGELFLITDSEGYVHVSTFWKLANEFSDEAIAWMPLPEPYKGGGA